MLGAQASLPACFREVLFSFPRVCRAGACRDACAPEVNQRIVK